MPTMQAMSLNHGELAVREVPRPVPGPGQILVRTLACAICATDHHYVDHPEVAAADRSEMQVYAPDEHVIMGHEFCGEVVEYGPQTNQAWPIGARITAAPALLVGDKLRIIGMAPDAPGAFGEYFLVSEGFAKALPDTIPVEQLALVDAMAVGWYYTKLGTTDPGAVHLVIGLGAIGLSVVAALKHRGVTNIIASDYSPSRREVASTIGADAVLDPAVEPTFAGWRRHAWGSEEAVHDRMQLAGLPSCVVYECVGVEGVLTDIVNECPIGTRVFSAGGAQQDCIPSNVAHLKGMNFQFGGGPMPDDWFETCDLVASGQIDPSPLIGEIVDLDGLVDAFNRARRSDAPPRIVFKPSR